MFAQHINVNEMNIANSQEFMRICSEYPECKARKKAEEKYFGEYVCKN